MLGLIDAGATGTPSPEQERHANAAHSHCTDLGVAAQEDPEKVLAAADAESKIKRSKVSLVKMIRWCTSVVASQQHADSCAAGQGSQR